GLPATGGSAVNTYALQFEVLVRDDANPARLTLVAALVDKTKFDDNNRTERIQIEDLSNGSALALAFTNNLKGCDLAPVNALPAADFIFLADISASTDNDRGTIAQASGLIFTGLQNNGVDFRVGVVPHTEN